MHNGRVIRNGNDTLSKFFVFVDCGVANIVDYV